MNYHWAKDPVASSEAQGDQQGLGSTKRSKKRFEAQPMVMLLGPLAHNIVIKEELV